MNAKNITDSFIPTKSAHKPIAAQIDAIEQMKINVAPGESPIR